MSNELKLLKSLILRNDLEETRTVINTNGLHPSIAHIKTACIAFHNLLEFERTLRPLYKAHGELGAGFNDFKPAVEFFAYLRNKFAGHVADELLAKTIEWKPEVLLSLKSEQNADIILFYNFALLETAINTYVDQAGAHKIFESDTDFGYPPDAERFTSFLLTTIDHASDYLTGIEAVLKHSICVPKDDENRLGLFIKAGQTDFTFIAGKKKR